MIVRVFEARIRAGKLGEFEELLKSVSIPLVLAQPGLLECRTGRPVGGANPDTFVMVSVWRDVPSIQAFAGDDWEQPVIPDPREAAIIEASTVRHFEVLGVE